MPNWITVTIALLEDARAAKLVDALRTKALANGQTDPMPRAIETATTELRASIGFSGKYQVDADPSTVPASLKDLVVRRALRLGKERLMMALTETETKDEDQWQRRLEQLNGGRWPVEQPDTIAPADTVQTAASSPRIKTKSREFSRSNQDGA